MPLKQYKNSDENTYHIIGNLDVKPDTSIEKVQEMLEEYCAKIGMKNINVHVWKKHELSDV